MRSQYYTLYAARLETVCFMIVVIMHFFANLTLFAALKIKMA